MAVPLAPLIDNWESVLSTSSSTWSEVILPSGLILILSASCMERLSIREKVLEIASFADFRMVIILNQYSDAYESIFSLPTLIKYVYEVVEFLTKVEYISIQKKFMVIGC
jgi:hypothetical protein